MIGSTNTTKAESKHGAQTENKHRTEPPRNDVLHNNWKDRLRRVILVLKRLFLR